MHVFQRHITSLRSQALAVLAANQARAADPSLNLSDRQVATFNAEEAQAMVDILDCMKPNLGPKEARKIAARIRDLLGGSRECQPVRVGCL
ncbi:hypothetical protein D6B98_39395 [Bradyrhizobium sp. LVM 105]|uniref:Uncharacterized protein n=1 Tax=Bradyrhizobium frederickii TaxID=2560054 RepID=A0A4Y9NKR2_9BRAD|nr:hypothetical protein D6B98_39395 [Bradyrhizobium sp. LVM 105]TFV27789.1 hypothetical protein E4K66_39460 [Bradyrhizobium frederickii]TFV67095.1 hypothetical protein E4K64_39005 [Bradyrhizobium frederickii]